jgi:hypothetical protein
VTIFEAIKAHLDAQVGITALVSTRIYQGEREQSSALPAISFDEIPGGDSWQDLSDGSVGLAFGVFQFNCYSNTTKQAAQLRELVRLAFQNHSPGLMGGASGVRVFGCIYSGNSGGFEPVTWKAVRSVDFEIQYTEATS